MKWVCVKNFLTLGCHLSYWMLKFFPIDSRAFWGAIESGSVKKRKLKSKRGNLNACIKGNCS